MATLLGIKHNMTTRFTPEGFKVPVTKVVAEPNVVLLKKEQSTVIGLGKRKKVKKTENAYVKTVGYTPRYIKQVKQKNTPISQDNSQPEENKTTLGQKITVEIFEAGDEVRVTGTTKGRGFAGVVKRWGFHGGPKTHGQSDRHRAPGSIGAGTTPGRVYKGKRMAGHMGAAQLTVTGLEVIDIDKEKNILFIKGSVPGARNGLLIIEKTGKVKGYTPPPPPNEEKQAEKEEKAEAEAKENKETKGTEETEETKVDSKEEQNTSVPSDTSATKEQENAN